MSLSFMRRTRAKSVLEVLEEDCRFTFCRLSEGNDVDAILRLGVDNRNRYALEQAQRHKTPLVVTKTIILKRKGVALNQIPVSRQRSRSRGLSGCACA